MLLEWINTDTVRIISFVLQLLSVLADIMAYITRVYAIRRILRSWTGKDKEREGGEGAGSLDDIEAGTLRSNRAIDNTHQENAQLRF